MCTYIYIYKQLSRCNHIPGDGHPITIGDSSPKTYQPFILEDMTIPENTANICE